MERKGIFLYIKKQAYVFGFAHFLVLARPIVKLKFTPLILKSWKK